MQQQCVRGSAFLRPESSPAACCSFSTGKYVATDEEEDNSVNKDDITMMIDYIFQTMTFEVEVCVHFSF